MNRKNLKKFLEEIITGKDVKSLFLESEVSPSVLYFTLKAFLQNPDRLLLRKVAAKGRISAQYLLDRVGNILEQIDEFRAENPYSILHVTYHADYSTIHKNWKDLLKQCHPDRMMGEGNSVAQRINHAFQILKSSETRKAYDRQFAPLLAIVKDIEENPLEFHVLPRDAQRRFRSLAIGALATVMIIAVVLFLLNPSRFFISNSKKSASLVSGKTERFSSPQDMKFYASAEYLGASSSGSTEVVFPIPTRGFVSAKHGKGAKQKTQGLTAKRDVVTNIAWTNLHPESKEREKKGSTRENVTKRSVDSDENSSRKINESLHNPLKLGRGDDNTKIVRNSKQIKPIKSGEYKQEDDNLIEHEKKSPQKPLLSSKDSIKNRENGISKILVSSVKGLPPNPIQVIYKYLKFYREGDFTSLFSLFEANAVENGVPIKAALKNSEVLFKKLKIERFEFSNIKQGGNGRYLSFYGDYILEFHKPDDNQIFRKTGKLYFMLARDGNYWLIKKINYFRNH